MVNTRSPKTGNSLVSLHHIRHSRWIYLQAPDRRQMLQAHRQNLSSSTDLRCWEMWGMLSITLWTLCSDTPDPPTPPHPIPAAHTRPAAPCCCSSRRTISNSTLRAVAPPSARTGSRWWWCLYLYLVAGSEEAAIFIYADGPNSDTW